MKKRPTRTLSHKAKPHVEQRRPASSAGLLKTRLRNTLRMTEDEADAIICIRRKNQEEYSLEEAMRRLGYEVERPVQK